MFQVLQEVQRELIHYGTTDISVMELSHRSGDYAVINNTAQQVVRDLLWVYLLPVSCNVLLTDSCLSEEYGW
jgi:phosphoserine aminotransferase